MNNNQSRQPPLPRIKTTAGQRIADKAVHIIGSWKFVLWLIIFLILWISLNIMMVIRRWDPYPFILLNLILSCLAAIQEPLILMSQNREAQRDRLRAEYDYRINRKAEREIEDMQKDLDEIKKLLKKKR